MRDHPQHGTEILGSGWGWRDTGGGGTRGRWVQAWRDILGDGDAWADRGDWGPDQRLLARWDSSRGLRCPVVKSWCP